MAIQIWQPGDKIKNDRFDILKQLGKGGFGITYLAEDTIRRQQIVIKTLNANQQGEADFVQKQGNFVNEGFMLKTFNHPHIVKVYEMIQVGDLSGLVMEYIPGQDLADYIIANGRLCEAEALNYIDQIAQALDCVHQQKFFHRDVKPHNIMLRQDRGEAVLIDFGIAKEFVDLETIYLSNSLGTELYKPIEQYEKRGKFGAYTDIYALAVTLYHLLTGAAPGGGSPLYTSKARKDAQDKGWGANLDEHLWGELANAGVSESTQAAIKAGMEIEPSQRPQNMTEFRKLLKLVTTSPATTSYPSPKIFVYYPYELSINFLAYRSKQSAVKGSQNIAEFPVLLKSTEDKIAKSECESKRVIKTELDDPYFLCSHGHSLFESGRYREAIHSYERAIEIQPDNPFFLCSYGYVLNRLGKYEEAIHSYERAIEIQPDNPFFLCSYGYVLNRLGKYEEAIRSYDRALKIEPGNPHYWNNRGIVWSKLGKYEEAIRSYDRALEILPNDLEISENRLNAVRRKRQNQGCKIVGQNIL